MINTCSFIRDAKEESIEEIFFQTERKAAGKTKRVYVVGCLAQRYKKELIEAMPEVDGFYSFGELSKQKKKENFDLLTYPDRHLSTPTHYAYLKISEGCDRQCAFCAIPNIRGKQVSKTEDFLIREATLLAEKGVKELILIAQDLTNWGMDISKQKELDRLLKSLTNIQGIEWIRLHYAYPNHFPYQILDVMREYSQFCKYLDMPLQHIHEKVLMSMNRPSTSEKIYKLLHTIREKVPGIALRTTLLSGFPTEGKKEHAELLRFVEDIRFERLGVFAYSPEEGTPAFALGNPVKEKEKQKRVAEIMELQESISLAMNEEKVGKTLKVIIDSEENGNYIGRTEFDSPEVDNTVFVTSEMPLAIGNFYNVLIDSADYYDLYGSVTTCNS
jgi:ribosomal protein S12 methylthiotransferase